MFHKAVGRGLLLGCGVALGILLIARVELSITAIIFVGSLMVTGAILTK